MLNVFIVHHVLPLLFFMIGHHSRMNVHCSCLISFYQALLKINAALIDVAYAIVHENEWFAPLGLDR